MRASEKPDLDFTVSAMQRLVPRKRRIRRRWLDLGLFVCVPLMDGQLPLENGALLGICCVSDLALQQREAVCDSRCAVGQVRPLLQRTRPVETPARCVVAD